jgi:hypothetical protein
MRTRLYSELLKCYLASVQLTSITYLQVHSKSIFGGEKTRKSILLETRLFLPLENLGRDYELKLLGLYGIW